jgi:hypothetical protein
MADNLSADPHGYAAATQNVRESAKWLLAAAAGVGAVLIAGLGLGSLGDLTFQEWPRIVPDLSVGRPEGGLGRWACPQSRDRR